MGWMSVRRSRTRQRDVLPYGRRAATRAGKLLDAPTAAAQQYGIEGITASVDEAASGITEPSWAPDAT